MRKIFVAGVVVLLALAFFAADRFLPASAPTGLRYEHDAQGRVSGRTLPDGRVASYAYDAAGRIVRVSYERPGRVHRPRVRQRRRHPRMRTIPAAFASRLSMRQARRNTRTTISAGVLP